VSAGNLSERHRQANSKNRCSPAFAESLHTFPFLLPSKILKSANQFPFNKDQTDYRGAFISIVLTALATVACVLFFDRPTAIFAHQYLRPNQVFSILTHIVDPVWPITTLALIYVGVRSLSGRFILTPFWQTVIVTSLAVIVSIAIKDQLKFVFGHTWPETWTDNNPSLISNGTYDFSFLHGGQGWASFPSGHMTQSVALCVMLLFRVPKYRWIWISYMVVVAVSLYGANFHFLGDMFAGAFIGICTAVCANTIWNRFCPGAEA